MAEPRELAEWHSCAVSDDAARNGFDCDDFRLVFLDDGSLELRTPFEKVQIVKPRIQREIVCGE